MERLTTRKINHKYTFLKQGMDGISVGQAIDRLAAYEDTGLEPEDFKRSFDEGALLKLMGQFLGVTPDRLRELAQADRDGKLPKYTIGDIIYDHFGMAWTVDSLEYVQCTYEKKWLYRCGHPETDDYRGLYQDEVLTRAEAAAALRREPQEDYDCSHGERNEATYEVSEP